MGRPRKPEASKVGHYQPPALLGDLVVEAPAPAFICPPPPRMADGGELLDEIKLLWEAYWFSPVAQATDLFDSNGHVSGDSLHYPVVRDWIRARNRLEQIQKVTDSNALVQGSMGQPVLNPLINYEEKLLARIARAEEVLGLTPLHAARLGITKGAEALTAAEMNRQLNEAGAGGGGPSFTVPALEEMRYVDLMALAREYQVRGRGRMAKGDLVDALARILA